MRVSVGSVAWREPNPVMLQGFDHLIPSESLTLVIDCPPLAGVSRCGSSMISFRRIATEVWPSDIFRDVEYITCWN